MTPGLAKYTEGSGEASLETRLYDLLNTWSNQLLLRITGNQGKSCDPPTVSTTDTGHVVGGVYLTTGG